MEIKLVKLDKDKYTLIYKEDNIMSEHVPLFDGKLSLKNCQAIENGYDLDELFESIPIGPTDENGRWKLRAGFITGFQKALEILSDKKFNEEHLKVAADWYYETKGKKSIDEYIQSLQQTEWDVEIITEPFLSVGDNFHDKYQTRPKLDENGCLILKRKV